MTTTLRHLSLVTVATLVLCSAAPAAVTMDGSTTLLNGDRPHLSVRGLAPRSEVTIESFRYAPESVRTTAGWTTQRLMFHAQARFWADASGRVDLDHAAPIAGSYSGADPRGLLWSGAVVGRSPEPEPPADVQGLAALGDNGVRLDVRVNGRVAAARDLTLIPWSRDVRFTTVRTAAVTGVFAAPAGARRRPTVILLHGSEGGSLNGAREAAGRFASRGYAALALIYFAWPDRHLAAVPQSFTHLPVERLAWARSWLASQPEADPSRVALVGGSKGAEFGLLGAATYPWVRAVVACVPSSVVWGGFGGTDSTSFTLRGKAVPAIPYGDYGPVSRGEITSAERHRRDRAAAQPALVAAAAIPVERSRAQLLLISGGRDAVWPSDAMSAEIGARMATHRAGERVMWRSFPDAGHYLCGTGSSPIRANEGDEPAMGGGLVSADGRDPGQAWEATLAFLGRALGPRALGGQH